MYFKMRKNILKTAGFMTIGVGIYLIHKSKEYDNIISKTVREVIDAEFEVIDD